MIDISILLHPIDKKETVKIDFQTESQETDVYEKLKLPTYGIYQFIDSDFLFNMDKSELDAQKIQYFELKRKKRTWLRLAKKTEKDLLIVPKNGFFFPYQYGYYFYLFTKEEIKPVDFEKWISKFFPNRFADFDESFAIGFDNDIKLLNEDDYILITNHDYQKDFGICGNEQIINKLEKKIFEFDNVDIERFERK
jgi:hypothetical protein